MYLVRSFALIAVLGSVAFTQTVPTGADAASWDTWVVDADAIAAMVEAPSTAERERELPELLVLADERDVASLERASYWNTASPSYRWVEVLLEPQTGPPSPMISRALALTNVAIYDTVVATWKAKYSDGNAGVPSPADLGGDLDVLVPASDVPSFPSEHAAVATVASEVLGHLFPDRAEELAALADEAMEARLLAGANVRSDLEAGSVIGRAVAEEIIALADADGSDTPWTFERPEGSLYAVEEPVFPVMDAWRPWVLESASQFRAPEPPAYDSERVRADLAEIRAVERNAPAMYQALYWGNVYAAYQIWYDYVSRMLFETRQADNAPYMALIYAGISVAGHDVIIACFDSKYAYVYARPSHLDPDVEPLLPVPPHPSYPAAHSCGSNAQANIVAHFFPEARPEVLQMARDAGQSRIYAGIHYQMDNEAGLEIGESVAGIVIDELAELTQPRDPEAVARPID